MLVLLFAEKEAMPSGIVHFITSKPVKIINMFTVWGGWSTNISCGTQLIAFFLSELPAIMGIILEVLRYQSFTVLQGCLEDRSIVS